MILYKSNLNTFKLSVVFEATGVVVKIGSSLNPNRRKKFGLPKSVKHSVYEMK